MKKTIGSTIAEIMVIHVFVSIAAKIDESELVQAMRMFFVSFISVLGFADPSENDLPVKVEEHQRRRDHGNDDPNDPRQADDKTENAPGRLPECPGYCCPKGFRGVLSCHDRGYDSVDAVKFL